MLPSVFVRGVQKSMKGSDEEKSRGIYINGEVGAELGVGIDDSFAALERDALRSKMCPKNYSLDDLDRYSQRIIELLFAGAIHTTCYLTETSANEDIRTNTVYKHIFKRYYGLNFAGLTPEFYEEFFEQLVIAKNKGFDIFRIAAALKAIKNKKDQESLQFSFISKIGATVDPRLPIYDSRIVQIFGLSNRNGIKGHDNKLAILTDDYKVLKDKINRLLNEQQMNRLISEIEQKMGAIGYSLPEERICDLILWGYHQIKHIS